MKKLLKGLFMTMLLVTVCLAMAGCGDEDGKSGSKSNNKEKEDSIVASKHFESGDYTETMEVIFKDGKASKVTITMDFKEEDTANSIKERLSKRSNMENAEIKIEGSKVTVEKSAEDFYAEEGLEYTDEKASKDGVKKIFEDNGFEIKE